MLTMISPIYEEEILYSWLARNYKYFDLNPVEYNMYLLGNIKSVNTYFYIGLQHFIDLLHNNGIYIFQSLNELINATTLIPFFVEFFDGKNINDIYYDISTTFDRYHINRILKIHRVDFIPGLNRIKFCPICAKLQYNKYGEIYLLREHQILNNYACHIHKCMLKYIDFNSSTQYCDLNDYDWRNALTMNLINHDENFYIDNSEFLHFFFANKKELISDYKQKIKNAFLSRDLDKIEKYCSGSACYYNISTRRYFYTDIDYFLNNSSTYEIIQLARACFTTLDSFTNFEQLN